MNRKLLLIMAITAMAGCAQIKEKPAILDDQDPAVLGLNDAAQRVARAAEQAALAQSVNGSGRKVTEEYRIDLQRLPPELQKPLLLESGFHGELETFLRSLTDVIGWKPPVVLGSRPATPLLVAMTEQRRPPVYWIADAAYQVGAQADVTVNPALKKIILQYKEGGGVR